MIEGKLDRLTADVERERVRRRLEGEHGERILARLVAIERQLGMRDKVEVPKFSRRRPLGVG
jgi:hypothetical protein